MAEIILPPEKNEETPQEPELNIDKPTENSKVITIEFEAKKTAQVSTKDTNQQLYTTDTDAWFEFKETTLENANGTYSVVFRNRHDGSIFQRTGDVVNGVAYYKIPEQEIRHAGKWRGQLVYTLENGDTTAREFGYDVKSHILDGKDVREIVVEDFETLISQLNSMKNNAELELADLVNTAERNELERQQFYESLVEDINDLQENYQELLDTGVLQTNINNKLEQLEEEYAPKLNEVTAQLAQNEKRVGQVDYVELIKRHNKFNQMQLKKMNAANQIEISIYDEHSHITYQFMYNNDDYIVQTRIWTGEFSERFIPYETQYFSDLTLTGSWVDANGSFPGYTEEVGATFETTVNIENDNDRIVFQFRSTNRSGLWKLTLDDERSVTISTYNESNSDLLYEVFGNVKKGTHVVKGEFLGDDPDNPPSGGTARGWMQSNARYFIASSEVVIEPIKDITLTEPSNKEFAFYIKPENGTYHQFVPFHGDPTAVAAETAVIRDGNKILNLDNLDIGEIVAIDSFSLEQHIYGRHPESGSTNLLEIWTTSIIDKDTGMLSIDGKMKVLEPVTFNNSYVIMGTARGDLFNYVVSSFRNQYFGDSETYGTNLYMEEERDWAESYVFLSDINKNIAVAYRFNNIKETLRQNEFGKDEDPSVMTYLNNRNDSVKKIYSRLWNTSLVDSGYTMRFSGDYIFGINNNFYDLLSLS